MNTRIKMIVTSMMNLIIGHGSDHEIDFQEAKPAAAKCLAMMDKELPRQSINNFADAMEAKLKTRDHLYPEQWSYDVASDLADSLEKKLKEFRESNYDNQEKAVDIANFAMMLWDKCQDKPAYPFKKTKYQKIGVIK